MGPADIAASAASETEVRAPLIEIVKEPSKRVSVCTEFVYRFLDMTHDGNPFHRGEHNYVPGMLYLALSAPYLDKPIRYLDLKFRGFVQFPTEITLEEKCIDGKKFINFGSGPKPDCRARFDFSDTNEIFDNRGLEDFASILGVGIDNPNLRKIWLTCLIPGELLKYSNGVGLYSSQSMAFLGDLKDTQFRMNVTKDKQGLKSVATSYVSGTNVVAEGEAVVKV